MPELPEVETLRRGLERTVIGGRITGVHVENDTVLRGQSPELLRERAVGHKIERIDRRGKYLLLRLSPLICSPTAISICVHLKMRGQLALQPQGAEAGKYLCVTIDVTLADGRDAVLRFYDMWRWGEFRALTKEELGEVVPALAAMGPEPLTESWDAEALVGALQGRKTAIKPALLDQTVVAGVGNIYADEALFRARLHPRRVAGSLTGAETARLAAAIKEVLTEAVIAGGTTSDNFFDIAGTAGRFTPAVYERGGLPCPVCGTILTRIKLAGRSAVFCEDCQPIAES